MLAAALIARHANRPARAVDDDDGVEAVSLARAAIVFEGLAGPERATHSQYCRRSLNGNRGCFQASSAASGCSLPGLENGAGRRAITPNDPQRQTDQIARTGWCTTQVEPFDDPDSGCEKDAVGLGAFLERTD